MANKKRSMIVPAELVKTPDDPPHAEVKEAFDEAAARTESGSRQLAKKLSAHNSKSPIDTAGDIDAAWDRSDVGEEGPSGSAPTPDQGVVEEVGEAMGVTFEDNEPVDLPAKMRRRDRNRWELNPASDPEFKKRQGPSA
jgi:hypothetical protein